PPVIARSCTRIFRLWHVPAIAGTPSISLEECLFARLNRVAKTGRSCWLQAEWSCTATRERWQIKRALWVETVDFRPRLCQAKLLSPRYPIIQSSKASHLQTGLVVLPRTAENTRSQVLPPRPGPMS